MNENPFVGAYWSSRKETQRDCAIRIAQFLQSIGHYSSLERWFLKGRSRRMAAIPLEVSVEAIHGQLKTNNRDANGTAIQELGFSFNIWNGRDDAPASLAVTCGAFSGFVNNSAVLYLPPQSEPNDADSQGYFKELLHRAVEAWNPDNAVVTSNEFLERKGGGLPWIVGGWLVYKRKTG